MRFHDQRSHVILALMFLACRADAASGPSNDQVDLLIIESFGFIALCIAAVFVGVTAAVAHSGRRATMVKMTLPWLVGAALVAGGALILLRSNGAREALFLVAIWSVSALLTLALALSIYAFYISRRSA